MMKTVIVILCLFSTMSVFGQTKKINGKVLDYFTKEPVMGVKISPVLNADDCISDPYGKFTALLHFKFYDNLEFTHPEYLSCLQKINAGDEYKDLKIIMIPLDISIDTLINAGLIENMPISGYVIDNLFKKRLRNICVRLESNQIIARTKNNGVFITAVPRSADSILLTHPEFISKKVSLKRGGKHLSNIGKIILSRAVDPKVTTPEYQIDTIIPANRKQNREIFGYTFDSITKKPAPNICLRLENNQIIYRSDNRGYFYVYVPRSAQNILLTHADFRSKMVAVDLLKRKIGSRYKVFLVKTSISLQDSLWIYKDSIADQNYSSWLSKKNMISFSLLELYRGALAFRYERFLSPKHAVGIHFSWYVFGWGYDVYPNFYSSFKINTSSTSHFTGFKTALFYRYYTSRKKKQGLYLEGKFLSGYFDFSELFSGNFWSFGGAASVGYLFGMKKSESAAFNLSVGLQYLPMNASETTDYGTNEIDYNWWYILGPGAIFELKLTIGGIF